MNSLTIRILVVVVPLAFLAGMFTLSEVIKGHSCKRSMKKAASGALRGLSHGPDIRV